MQRKEKIWHGTMKDIEDVCSSYCWEEGIKLPTIENYPECNGAYNNSNSSKRFCFDD
jgi:hypothetical protein